MQYFRSMVGILYYKKLVEAINCNEKPSNDYYNFTRVDFIKVDQDTPNFILVRYLLFFLAIFYVLIFWLKFRVFAVGDIFILWSFGVSSGKKMHDNGSCASFVRLVAWVVEIKDRMTKVWAKITHMQGVLSNLELIISVGRNITSSTSGCYGALLAA